MSTSNHIKSESSHIESIKALAEQIDVPMEKVSKIYNSTLESIKTNARIQDYLHVLTSKKVRDDLRH